MRIYWDTPELQTSLQREVDRIFHGFARPLLGLRQAALEARPNVSLGQDEDNLYVEAVAPGIDPASLEVTLEDNVLRIEGKREAGAENDDVRWLRRERVHGAFTHRLRIPVEVDAEKIEAAYAHGVLKVTLPKAAAAKPRRIEVKAS